METNVVSRRCNPSATPDRPATFINCVWLILQPHDFAANSNGKTIRITETGLGTIQTVFAGGQHQAGAHQASLEEVRQGGVCQVYPHSQKQI